MGEALEDARVEGGRGAGLGEHASARRGAGGRAWLQQFMGVCVENLSACVRRVRGGVRACGVRACVVLTITRPAWTDT